MVSHEYITLSELYASGAVLVSRIKYVLNENRKSHTE